MSNKERLNHIIEEIKLLRVEINQSTVMSRNDVIDVDIHMYGIAQELKTIRGTLK